jgi:hypothetical protein
MPLIVRKGAQELVRFADTGDVQFSPWHSEATALAAVAGELRIRRTAVAALGATVAAGVRRITLARRLHDVAVLPGLGLQLRRGSTANAELSSAGDLYVRGANITSVTNPATAGGTAFTSVVYASSGLSYGGAFAAPYAVFLSPTAGWTTGRIDISDFCNVTSGWSFTSANAPINGVLRVPAGAGPFPVVLFVHGNHTPNENSTLGYVYLMELLASHGILAGSIDCNFLNGFNAGENDGRAIVHLEHVKQLKTWNGQAGHPLHGKVDLGRILIVGHSRGGEAVGHASYFNTLTSITPDPGAAVVPLDGSAGLGPYGFSLAAAVAIAPTDGQYVPVTGPTKARGNYALVHGSRDGDVWNFPGQKTLDRSHPVDPGSPASDAEGFKSLLWVIGANHNFFNSVWAGEGSPTLTRAQQENVAKVYIGAFAQGLLLGRAEQLALIKDHRLAWSLGFIPATVGLVSQYQDRRRIFVDHYEQATPAAPSPPVGGAITVTSMTIAEQSLNVGSGSPEWQETRAAKAAWSAVGGRYHFKITAGTLATSARQRLVIRAAQSTAAANVAGTTQDFRVELSDGTHVHGVKMSSLGPIDYPAELDGGVRRVVMQTFRIPLKLFADAGVNVSDLRYIELQFDEPQGGTGLHAGSLYLDDLQLSE